MAAPRSASVGICGTPFWTLLPALQTVVCDSCGLAVPQQAPLAFSTPHHALCRGPGRQDHLYICIPYLGALPRPMGDLLLSESVIATPLRGFSAIPIFRCS